MAVTRASTSALSAAASARRASSGRSAATSATDTGPTHWPVTGHVRLKGRSPTTYAAANSSTPDSAAAAASTGSPSSSPPPRTLPAAATLLSAARMAGNDMTMPIIAPPSSRPMPSGRLKAPKPYAGASWAATDAGIQPAA